MMHSRDAAEAISQQRRDALMSQAHRHRLVRSASPSPKTDPEAVVEPWRVRRLVWRLAWVSR